LAWGTGMVPMPSAGYSGSKLTPGGHHADTTPTWAQPNFAAKN
jgi:hypothetical protein